MIHYAKVVWFHELSFSFKLLSLVLHVGALDITGYKRFYMP